MEVNHEEFLSGVMAGVKSTIMTRFGEEDGKITALQDLVARERTITCDAQLQVKELSKQLEEERVAKEDNKVAMAAIRQEFEGKLAQEIVVRERVSEELASAKRELAAAASACQEQIVSEVEKARVALHSNYDRKLVAATLAAEKKFVKEVEGFEKKNPRVQGQVRQRVRATLEIEGALQEGRVQHRNVNCTSCNCIIYLCIYNLPFVGPIAK